MHYTEFISKTLSDLDDNSLEKLKEMLIGKKIKYYFFSAESVDVRILAEKLCDYFYTIEKASFKEFDKLIKEYVSDFDDVVGSRIAKAEKKKGYTPRSRAYYEKAIEIKKQQRCLSFDGLVEYTRIMTGLYTAICRNYQEEINDFNYSFDAVDIRKLIHVMERKDKKAKKVRESSRVILICMYFYIKNKLSEA